MNYKNIFLNGLLIVLFGVFFSSCQKVIDIDLNSASPEIVIEGSVSNQTTLQTVKLSKTVDFSDANVFPPVTGASVTINDNVGNSETLTEISSGVYQTTLMPGVVGRKYTINVVADGKNYQAVSTMAAPVAIDSLIVKTSAGFGGGPGNGKDTSLTVRFTDPAGIANYYRLVEMVNGALINTISITSDNLRDGEVIEENLRGTKLQAGDQVVVQLKSIDKNVYEYLRTFNNASGGNNFNSSSPANPTSNLSNGALGYFSAYSVTSKTIVIQ